MKINENQHDLKAYRVWGRFTILEVMGALAVAGLLVACLANYF